MTLYIIDQTETFKGHAYSTMSAPEGQTPVTVDYTKGLTLQQYKDKENNQNLVALPWEKFEVIYRTYLGSLQGDWKEISEKDWYDMLECLPPCNWHCLNSRFNSFYCSEAYTADLHGFYIKDKIDGRFYSARRSRYIKDADLLSQLTELTK